jgi:DNA polymerase-3 subunit beta
MGAVGNSIVFDTSELSSALREVLGAVQRRNTIPILSNVLIAADDSGLVRLTATDLDIAVTRELQARSVGYAASFTLDAHRLAEVVGSFVKGSQVTIELASPDGAIIKSGRARVRFATLLADDFPRMVQKAEDARFALAAKDLATALSAVRHAISTEETRYYLNGIFLHVRAGKLCYAATDGIRLARLVADLPDGAANMPSIILRTTCVNLARQAAEERDCVADILVGDSKVTFVIGDLTIIAKVIDGTYPEYERVIPTSIARNATVDRDDMLTAVSRVMKASSEKTRSALLTFRAGGILSLTVRSQQHGDAVDEVPCNLDGDGDFAVGFNLAFLHDALTALDVDTVRFGLTDAVSPTLITSAVAGELTLVVVPMRA